MTVTAPVPLFRRQHQTADNGIAMHVTQLLHPLLLREHDEIVEAGCPRSRGFRDLGFPCCIQLGPLLWARTEAAVRMTLGIVTLGAGCAKYPPRFNLPRKGTTSVEIIPSTQ